MDNNHFTPEEWNDYARGVAPDAVGDSMRSHLDGGCARCARALATSRALVSLAATDRSLAPPQSAIRTIKAMFCLDHPREAAALSKPRLIFDSRLASVGGTRSGGRAAERNLTYETDTVALNLVLKASGDSLGVAGGGTSRDGEPIGGIPVALVRHDNLLTQAFCGEEGDFLLADVPVGSLTLRLLLDDRELVEVELPPEDKL